jgi:hypothetical protein
VACHCLLLLQICELPADRPSTHPDEKDSRANLAQIFSP